MQPDRDVRGRIDPCLNDTQKPLSPIGERQAVLGIDSIDPQASTERRINNGAVTACPKVSSLSIHTKARAIGLRDLAQLIQKRCPRRINLGRSIGKECLCQLCLVIKTGHNSIYPPFGGFATTI